MTFSQRHAIETGAHCGHLNSAGCDDVIMISTRWQTIHSLPELSGQQTEARLALEPATSGCYSLSLTAIYDHQRLIDVIRVALATAARSGACKQCALNHVCMSGESRE